MASADSGPSRASRSRRLPSAGQGMGIEFERRRIIGALQHFRQKDMRRFEGRCAALRAAAPATRVPSRPWHSANSSSSLRPQSGERSSAARLRSSSRCSTKRPSAIRSITAICSASTMRSAPATGNAAQLQLADHFAAERFAARQQDHDVAGPDRRVMAGQGRARWRSSLRIWPATASASCTTGLDALRPHRRGGNNRFRLPRPAACTSQNSTPPGAVRDGR